MTFSESYPTVASIEGENALWLADQRRLAEVAERDGEIARLAAEIKRQERVIEKLNQECYGLRMKIRRLQS